jgi:hypothetical protein
MKNSSRIFLNSVLTKACLYVGCYALTFGRNCFFVSSEKPLEVLDYGLYGLVHFFSCFQSSDLSIIFETSEHFPGAQVEIRRKF